MAISVIRCAATLASTFALSAAPLAFATIVTPAVGRADCEPQQAIKTSQTEGTGQEVQEAREAQADDCERECPDDKVRDDKSGRCLDPMAAIAAQIGPLPAVPQLPGIGPLPDVVLPGVCIGLPDVHLPPIVLPPPPKAPARPKLCGPEINTPIPMVGTKPCI